MFRNILFLSVLFFSVSMSAMAVDLVATYQYSDGETVKISTRDSGHVRMDNSDEGYTLLKGDKIYSVLKDEDGNWIVMDMDQMKGIGSMMGTLLGEEETIEQEIKFSNTGKKETIAGYTGDVFRATIMENGEVVDTEEIVFCKKKEIVQLNEAWMSIAQGMGKIAGGDVSKNINDSIMGIDTKKYGGMLRTGDDMILKSLLKISLDDSHYELPSGSEIMDMQAPFMGMQDRPEDDEDENNVLSEDAKDIGNAAHDELKNATMDEVREGVRGLFNGLFD